MTISRTSAETPAELPDRLPVIPLRSTIVFPLGVIGIQVGAPATIEMLASRPEDGLLVALVVPPGDSGDTIKPETLNKVGIAARLSDRLNLPGGSIQATVQGLQRVRLAEVSEEDGFIARIEPVEEAGMAEDVAETQIARILSALDALAAKVDRISGEVPAILRMNVTDPGRFADLVAMLANFGPRSKDEVVQRSSVEERLAYVLDELEHQLRRVRQVDEAEEAAEEEEAQAEVTPGQRASRLKQRIKMLQAELGDVDPAEREGIELLRRIDEADLPGRVATRARAEVERLRAVGPATPDASEIRAYVDWLLHLPWQARSPDGTSAIDLGTVHAALDDALLGLEEPKERLLDYVAVAKLRGDLRGSIPCLVGPPDVGKSSLVEALARGLRRPLAHLELGGRGEFQIVGTRRTRPGAAPGKIVGALRDAGVRDPVFLLAELDRIGLGKVEGDPIEALETALKWEGRERFIDRYLDMPFDLSDTIFIATANDFYRVPLDLRELLVEIRIAGYTPEEKVDIARDRLLPRLVAEHGLDPDDVDFSDEPLFYIARSYARDSGLGQLRRSLSTLLRTRARAKAQGDLGAWDFNPERIESILGLPRYVSTTAESAPEIGVVTGLAWTAAGGELMFIEALKMPGSGRLIITGMLGDVMRESVNAAYSYVRSRGDRLKIPEKAFLDCDVHVHFPVGAIPKDGPSAGIAVTLAIASTLSDRPIPHDLAMTGEVTLRGKVMDVGGVKEKVLAAYRAGLRNVILPRGNERDLLRDVPVDVREKIKVHFVERMDEVIDLALLDAPKGAAKRTKKKTTPKREKEKEEEPQPRAARG